MSFRPLVSMFWALLLALFFSNLLDAQTTTSGGLNGVVTDPSDAVVPDANVDLKDNAKGTRLSTKTTAEGAYLFSFLLPGSYTLSVTHPGFQTATRALDVLLGPPATLNVRLVIASASNTIKVTEESPLIKAENGDVSTTMDRQQVSQVPNPGNDLTYIAQTAPGTIMNTDGGFGNFSILGMPGTSNLFTLNGLNDNDFGGNVNITGALNLLLGTNEIQETTLVTNGYSGQFGGAAGANVNYITKSGGNDFHGNAVYFWNGSVFNANDWINKALGKTRPFDNANQWAGSIGGPIKKDKLFFFFDSEGLRAIIPLPFQVVLPSPQFEAATIANISSIFGPTSPSNAFYKQMFNLYNDTPGASGAIPGNFSDPLGCTEFAGLNGLGTTVPCAVHFLENIGRPSDQALVSGRVDWNIGPNDRAFLLVQYDHGFQASYTDAISPLFNANSNQPSWQGQLIETHAFGPTATNQILVAGWWQGKIVKLANPSQTLSAFPTTLDWNFTTSTFTNLGGVDNSLPQGRNATRFQVSEDFVKTWGNQQLGLGVNFLRADVTDFAYASNAIGQLIPLTLNAFYQGGVDPGFLEGTDPNPDFTFLNQSFPQQVSQRIAFYRLGLYGQDEWHARTNLTLTLALRAEHQSNPVCQRRCFARLTGPFESVSHDPDQPYDQAILIDQKQAFQDFNSLLWSPRFSFAWQPIGVSHNTVVRGGIGIFYDPLPAALINFFSSNPPIVNSFTIHGYSLTPDETNSLFQNASASDAAFVSGFAAGQTLAQIRAVDSNFSPPSITVPNNKTYSPQYQKWSLEVQQTFGTGTSVSIGYYGNHGIHELIFNPSANAFGFGPFPTGLCASPPVPPCADPRFSDVTEITTPGVSNYNGMVASFQHRFTRWGQGLFQANYTYGHALDEVSNGGYGQFTIGSSIFPQDPYNLRGSYGPADYDVRHSFNANYVWQVPVKAALRGHGSDYLVKGWQISGTIFARTGFPYTVIDGAEASKLNTNNFFGTIYAVPVGPLGSGTSCGEGAAIPLSPHPCQPPQMLANHSPNPNALFVQTGCETGFNAGTLPAPSGPCNGPAVSIAQARNRFRGPSYFNTDFGIMKNTKIPGWEKGELGIGFQFFNFFNHPNFGLPDNNLPDPGFGRIFYMESPPTSILGAGLGGDASPRNIQLKVQLHF